VDANAEMLGFFINLKDAQICNLKFKNPRVEGKGFSRTSNNPSPSGIGILAGFVKGERVIKEIKATGANIKSRGRFSGFLVGR